MKTQMKLTYRFFTVLLIVSLMMGCSKDSDLGPQGPKGEPGDDGQDGADGVDGQNRADGQNGATGTANVIYSDWIPSDFPETIDSRFEQWNMFAPKLTQEVHDNGVVLVFSTNNFDIGSPLLNGDYRYIIIPGGIPSNTGPVISSKAEVLDYTKMSYEEIAEHFNIPD